VIIEFNMLLELFKFSAFKKLLMIVTLWIMTNCQKLKRRT